MVKIKGVEVGLNREKLIEYLDTHCIDGYGELQTWQVADFIIEDRKRIVEPLIKARDAEMASWNFWNKAIKQTIKNAGIGK